ncbi:hypothetical protein N177_3464 [Lutibaculum baratangense AMV1]|uniref:Uncharacterized protein n=1 Tax=Lutibaculum baratangense AMV1 TaxID=631454 RepID=V4RB85_9HYPH|nr:hypothetical protein N177_3464 [Lutibaculum baratangense AMV1]
MRARDLVAAGHRPLLALRWVGCWRASGVICVKAGVSGAL